MAVHDDETVALKANLRNFIVCSSLPLPSFYKLYSYTVDTISFPFLLSYKYTIYFSYKIRFILIVKSYETIERKSRIDRLPAEMKPQEEEEERKRRKIRPPVEYACNINLRRGG